MRHVTAGEVRKQAIAEGMQTMFENGCPVAGVTTIEEVLRVTRGSSHAVVPLFGWPPRARRKKEMECSSTEKRLHACRTWD